MKKLWSFMMPEKNKHKLDTRLVYLLTAMGFDGRPPNFNQQAVAISLAKLVAKRCE